jgi:hypothetical protein
MCNEPSGSIKFRESFHHQNNCQLFKKDPAPWSSFYIQKESDGCNIIVCVPIRLQVSICPVATFMQVGYTFAI